MYNQHQDINKLVYKTHPQEVLQLRIHREQRNIRHHIPLCFQSSLWLQIFPVNDWQPQLEKKEINLKFC